MESNKQKTPLTLHYDQLVIGGTLEAFYFAHTFNCPLIYSLDEPPFSFEQHPEVGNKLKLWYNLNFLINLSGNNPFAENCKSIYYLDKETLKIITRNDKIFYVKYKRLWIFDDLGCHDLPVDPEEKNVDCEILDSFRILDSWNPHTNDIYREDNILKEFHFFKNKPHSKKTKFKHFYVLSIIPISELSKLPEYFIRIRAEQILGSKKIEHVKRMIRVRQTQYTDAENIYFCDIKFDDMFPFSHFRKKITYQKYLKGRLKL